jgi:hypothetical protein
MFSLIQSKRVRGNAGDPLPTVFKTLEQAGVVFRLGQLVLVAAGPGTGKSAFTLTLTLKSKAPALYFSADSDAYEQLTRAICVLTGYSVETSRKAVLADDLGAIEPALAGVPVRFNYDASPTLDTIENGVANYVQLYGDYPQLIVVDNVTNVMIESAEGERGSQRLEDLMQYLHDMARKTGACVVGLHHVTGGYNDADKPIPLSGVKDQIGRVPEMILTLFKPSESILGVSPVKNRGGKPDPSGKNFAELSFEGDRMRIADISSSYTAPEEPSIEKPIWS